MKKSYRFFVDVEAGHNSSPRLEKKIAGLFKKDNELSKAVVHRDPLNIDTRPVESISGLVSELRRYRDVLMRRLGSTMLDLFVHGLLSLSEAAAAIEAANRVLITESEKHIDRALPLVEVSPANIDKLSPELLRGIAQTVMMSKGIEAPFDCHTVDTETLISWLKKHMFISEKVN